MNFFSNCSFRLISYRFLTAFQIRRMSSVSKTITERYEVRIKKVFHSLNSNFLLQEAISTLNDLQSNQVVLKSNDQRGRSMQNILCNLSFLNIQVNER